MTDLTLLTDCELLQQLGLELPPQVESLRRRATTTQPGVAVVGMFSRGKSTLFNQLVGTEIAAVGNLPTTRLITEASRGQRFAAAYWADRSNQLPLESDSFRQALTDIEEPYPERVEISGPFRLPPGLRLVDTPGSGAASELNERHWYLSGAGAALHVLAFPPGPQGEDWKLHEALDEVFDGAIGLVLKATSSDIDDDELAEVAERAERHGGRPVTLVPPTPPEHPWGEGEGWKAVEGLIEDLELRARQRGTTAASDLRTWLDQRFVALAPTDLSEAGRALAIEEHLSVPGASPQAATALRRIGFDLRNERARLREEERARQEAEVNRFAPRRNLGERLLQECSARRDQPYEELRATLPQAHELLQRVEAWRRGRTDAAQLAELEARIDWECSALRTNYLELMADGLIERGRQLLVGAFQAPAEAYRDVQIWLTDADRWLGTSQPQAETTSHRRGQLRELVRQIRIDAP